MGDYQFCFSNKMSSSTEKFVDFEITVSANPTHREQEGCPSTDRAVSVLGRERIEDRAPV